MKNIERFTVKDNNGYMMRRTAIKRTVREFNDRLLPLMLDMGMDSEIDVSFAFHKLGNDGTVYDLVDYAVTNIPVPGLTDAMHRRLLMETVANAIQTHFPHWHEYPSGYEGEERYKRRPPQFFTPLGDSDEAFVNITSHGLEIDETALDDAYTIKPSNEQLVLFSEAERFVELCNEMHTDPTKLFKRVYNGWELDFLSCYPVTRYCLLR